MSVPKSIPASDLPSVKIQSEATAAHALSGISWTELQTTALVCSNVPDIIIIAFLLYLMSENISDMIESNIVFFSQKVCLL